MGDIGRFLTYWQDTAPPRGNAAERSPESVARVLRNARILQGYALTEAAHTINVRRAHLEAIEDGRFCDLPPLVYAKGFVSAYADFLDLDAADIVARFCLETASQGTPSAPSRFASSFPPRMDDATERRVPSSTFLAVACVLACLAYGLWRVGAPDDRALALSVPPLPPRFQEKVAVRAAPVPVSLTPAAVLTPLPATATAAPLPAEPLISVRAKNDSWLQLRNAQGKRFASLVLRTGDVYVVPRTSAGMILSTGDLHTLDISVDGRPVQLASVAAHTRYDIALEPTRLLSGTAVQD